MSVHLNIKSSDRWGCWSALGERHDVISENSHDGWWDRARVRLKASRKQYVVAILKSIRTAQTTDWHEFHVQSERWTSLRKLSLNQRPWGSRSRTWCTLYKPSMSHTSCIKFLDLRPPKHKEAKCNASVPLAFTSHVFSLNYSSEQSWLNEAFARSQKDVFAAARWRIYRY